MLNGIEVFRETILQILAIFFRRVDSQRGYVFKIMTVNIYSFLVAWRGKNYKANGMTLQAILLTLHLSYDWKQTSDLPKKNM